MKCKMIAHRGLSELAPENTISAFQQAIIQGANGIEFDVQLSQDHEFVIIHDLNLERLSNSQGKVKDLTLKQLKELDVGSWFSPQFKGEKIPTLKEVLDLCLSTNLSLYIEIKDCDHWQEEDINNLLELLMKSPLLKQIYVISFDHDFLVKLRQKSSLIKIGCNVKTKTEYLQALTLAKTYQFNCICSEYHLLLNEPELITITHKNQLEVVAWTVNHLEEIKQLIRLNIQAIMSNNL